MAWLASHPRAQRRSAGFARGSTLFELLFVIAIAAVIATSAAPFLTGSLSRRELDAAAAEAVDALREAQLAAMHGRAGGLWGVRFEADKFTLFRGAAFNPAESRNTVHDLSGDVRVTAINLGGGPDVHFGDARGLPAETGTVVFTEAGGETLTVTVNAAGMTEVE